MSAQEIKIGLKFKKILPKNKYVICEVYDIIKQSNVSTRTGQINTDTIYIARSQNYFENKPFKVPMNSILRGQIN